MSRSVSRPSNAVHTVYSHLDYDDDDSARDQYDDALYALRATLHRAFPSVTKDDGWLGNEDRIVASNQFANFTLSEYCGLVAVCVVPKEDDYASQGWRNLRDHWLEGIYPKLKQAVKSSYGETLVRLGTASNGEAFFQRAA